MHLSNKSIIERLSVSGKPRRTVIGDIIHYYDKNHPIETFWKTALAWANENDDPISVSDLLHLEFEAHEDKEEGLRSIKHQLTNDKLLFWITRTFTRFYPKSPCIMWTKAIIMSLFQLGISYFFFIFDIYTDIQLTNDYYDAYKNISNYQLEMQQCARRNTPDDEINNQSTCFLVADEYPHQSYKNAYYITWCSLLISLFAYVIGIVGIFDMKNLTEKILQEKKKDEDFIASKSKLPWKEKLVKFLKKVFFYLKKTVLWIIIRLFWPFFHIYRKVRYERVENKSSRRKKVIEFETIWIMVRTIEQGIEATIQLLIVLYLLVPFYDEIHEWSFQTRMKKISHGLFHFLTGGKYEACLLEKVLGKLALNVVGQSLSLTILKHLKYGMSFNEHVFNMLPLFSSYFIQIFARLYALRVFFVTAEELFQTEDKGFAIGMFFVIHFLFILLIKLSFEVRRENCTEFCWKNFKFWMKFLINFCSSCSIYVQTNEYGTKPRENVHFHNTFLPQLLFQILILVEHLVIILFPLTLTKTDCLDRDTYIFTAWFVPVLWICSNICLIFNYKDCHTWSQTNGPSFSLVPEENLKNQENTSFESNEGSTASCHKYFNPEMTCYTYFCCFADHKKVTCSMLNCCRVKKVKKNIYQEQNAIEMNSQEPLVPNSTDSSFTDNI